MKKHAKLFGPLVYFLVIVVSCNGDRQKNSEIRVAAIMLDQGPLYGMASQGIRDAARKSGLILTFQYSYGDAKRESALVDAAIEGNAAVLVVSPVNAVDSAPVLERAALRGIKLVTIGARMEKPLAVCNVDSDHADLGRLGAKEVRDFVLARLGGKATLLVVRTQSDSRASLDRVDAFKRGIEGESGIRIIDEIQCGNWRQAKDAVTQVLAADPEVNVIWADYEDGVLGAVVAVNRGDMAGRVFVLGCDMSEKIGEFLVGEENVLQSVTAPKAYELGVAAVENALRVAHGQSTERNVALPGVVFSRRRAFEVSVYVSRLQDLAKPQ